MINNWLDSVNIILLAIFLAEILLARRIYRKTRRKNQGPQKIVFVFQDLETKTKFIQSYHDSTSYSLLPSHISESNLPHRPATPMNSPWTTISLATCTIAVFIISFILINWIQNPVLYLWTLRLLTVIVPLPFLTFPTLFQLRSFSTFSVLFIGLGIGLIFSILV